MSDSPIPLNHQKKFSSVKYQVLYKCNSLLAKYERIFLASGLQKSLNKSPNYQWLRTTLLSLSKQIRVLLTSKIFSSFALFGLLVWVTNWECEHRKSKDINYLLCAILFQVLCFPESECQTLLQNSWIMTSLSVHALFSFLRTNIFFQTSFPSLHNTIAKRHSMSFAYDGGNYFT